MRASVPAVFLALTFASPALAVHGPQGEPGPAAGSAGPLSTSADIGQRGEVGCDAGCAPKLPYAIDQLGDAAPAAIVAASAPASVNLPAVGPIEAGGGVRLLEAVSSEPPELKLAGLVTLAAPPAAPAPVMVPAPAPPRAPAAAPAVAPVPDPTEPGCPAKTVCS